MKTKFATLLALAALVVGGNAKADVVGLSTTSNSTSGFNTTRILTVTFNTTGLSGNRFTGISFASLGTVSSGATLEATLTNMLTFQSTTSTLAYVSAGEFIGFETEAGKIGSDSWAANSTYQLKVDLTGILTGASINNSLTPTVTNDIQDWIRNPAVDSDNVAFTVYAAVPEPGTMILTGTALAAGAVGAYFKRRRKAKAEVAA